MKSNLLHTYEKYFSYLSLLLILLSGIVLIGLQNKPEGWVLLGISFASLALLKKRKAKDFLLINISLAILGVTEINTEITYSHMFSTAFLLGLAVAIPYLVSTYIYKDDKIRFVFGSMKKWSKKQYHYIGLTAIISYLLIPFYLVNSGAYINWPSEADPSSLIRLFIGTNGLGIWDELFFVIVVLGILKHYYRFWLANIAQAILWTAFLYELGFTGWGPFIVFIFALLQGFVYKKTHSLLYVITIHLTVDFILFLALVNAHNPDYFNFFIT